MTMTTRNHNGGVSLRDYFERRILDVERISTEKWLGHQEAHELIASSLHYQEIEAADWRKASNEWREALGDIPARYVSREMMDDKIKAIKAEVRQNTVVAVSLTGVICGLVGFAMRAMGV